MRFLLDVHVHGAITQGLRLRGVEVMTCQEAGLARAKDIEIVQYAFRENWVIFSQDSDFLRICSTTFPHRGLVYTHKQNPINRIIQGLLLINEVLNDAEMENHIEFI